MTEQDTIATIPRVARCNVSAMILSATSRTVDHASAGSLAAVRPSVKLGRAALQPRLRERASLGVLDVTEWFGETSGGICTYLLQKSLYVAARPWLRHVPDQARLWSNSRPVGRCKLAWPMAVAFASDIYRLVAYVRGAEGGSFSVRGRSRCWHSARCKCCWSSYAYARGARGSTGRAME